jgi:hypothetical protein
MEQTEAKPVKIRRSRQQITQLLKEYDKSPGVTVKEFCGKHQIGEGAFYSARKRYRSKIVEPRKSGFIAIRPAPANEAAGNLFAEVKGIKLYQAVPAEYLKTLAS